MSKIKMADAFDLPVTGMMCDDLKMDCDIDKAELYTIAAINSYDDNQERIAELESFIERISQSHLANSPADLTLSFFRNDATKLLGASNEQ